MSNFFVILLMGVCCYCHAQQNSTVIGARANAMGYAASCQQDVGATFANPAGLAEVRMTQAFFTYDAMPSFPTFNRMAAGVVSPLKSGAAAMGVYRFGDDLYNEQILTAAFANTMGIASLGIKGSLVQYHYEDAGQKRVFTISAGGIVKFTPWLFIGACIININQPSIEPGQRLPTRLHIGALARASVNCTVTAEVEKDLDYDPTLRGGMEYEIHKKILVRSGFNLFPNAGYGGVGFRATRYQLDYAFTFTPNIGCRHQASVTYPVNKRKK